MCECLSNNQVVSINLHQKKILVATSSQYIQPSPCQYISLLPSPSHFCLTTIYLLLDLYLICTSSRYTVTLEYTVEDMVEHIVVEYTMEYMVQYTGGLEGSELWVHGLLEWNLGLV